MTTRLAHYCDRLTEAGWLAAAVLTPLFFNVYSSRVFEPDKLTLLRSIALVMAGAWLVRTLEEARSAAAAPGGAPVSTGELWRALWREPLVPQVLLLVLVYFVATAFSVVPRTSFWGSYQRLQGTYTTLSYVVIFFIVWRSLRTRAQLERLLNAIVLASLPVALYGVMQHYGLDPLPWAGDVQDRVTGNLGNAIFIAAYLIMAFFVTLERAVARFRHLLGEGASDLGDAYMGAVYLFALGVQLMAIYFTKSRGPWLGLLAGIYAFMLIALVALRRSAERGPLTRGEAGRAFTFALLSPLVAAIPAYLAFISTRRGRRWLWLSWCVQAVLGVALLAAFNLPRTPLAPLREVPGIGRLGQVFETETGTGRVRVLIWQGAVDLVSSNPLRALVGYGPESMFVAFNPAYPPDLAHFESRTATPDRSHNETFDALITTGLVGFAVYLALFVSIFFYGLRWLGLLGEGGGPRRLFLGLTLGGAGLGALTALLVDGSLRFAGVGVPVGLILGVAVYLAVAAFRSPAGEGSPPTVLPVGGTGVDPPRLQSSPEGGTVGGVGGLGTRELLLTSLLSLVVAHFVEIHFGIAISATRLYFWLALALLISVGTGRLNLAPAAEAPTRTPQPAVPAGERRRRRRRREVRQPVAVPERRDSLRTGAVAAGLLGALIVGTMLFGFTTNSTADTNPVRVIWNSLTALSVPNQPTTFAPIVLSLILLTLLLGAIMVVGEAEQLSARPRRSAWLQAFALYGGISLAGGLLFALLHASQLQANRDLGLIIFYYYAFALSTVLLLAAFLPAPRPVGLPLWRGPRALLYPALAGALGLMIWNNATVVRADIYYKQAWDGFHTPASQALAAGSIDQATAQRYYDAALYYYEKAAAWAPQEDYYLLFAGKALLERAQITSDPQQQLAYLQRSQQVLLEAQRLNPLDTDHTANLARLCRTWADSTSDATVREQKLAEALGYYEQATRLSPNNAALYDEWGETLLQMGRPEEALARYQQSLALDDRYAQTYLLLGNYYADHDPEQAARYAAQAAEVDPASMQVRAAVGYLYTRLGRLEDAIQEYEKVVSVYPQDYSAQKSLAVLYSQTGQTERALEAARAARAVAPESERAALDEFIAQLEAGQGAQP